MKIEEDEMMGTELEREEEEKLEEEFIRRKNQTRRNGEFTAR